MVVSIFVGYHVTFNIAGLKARMRARVAYLPPGMNVSSLLRFQCCFHAFTLSDDIVLKRREK